MAPPSKRPCPARPKPAGLNGGPILNQGPVTEPAQSACREGAARGVCCLEWEFGCHVGARGHLNHVQWRPVRPVAGGTTQSRHWHCVEALEAKVEPARQPWPVTWSASGWTGSAALHGARVLLGPHQGALPRLQEVAAGLGL
ncbi:unnamed protein product [Rangifer tarandus platyrhynchus]|uniref:Uncharacterized protein n=1 Tax=Rangifer tarandus platyrhynchus TaxID=3082113 RepID=A0AC59Z6L7_RANTA